MQLRKVSNYLLNKYPLNLAEIWDPCGFNVKFNLSEKIKAVVCAIDLTQEVLQLAIEKEANLIILHHPFKFAKTWQEEFILAPYKKQILTILKQKRINVLALHTNYDNHTQGTSHQIASQLGLEALIYNQNNLYPSILKFPISVKQLQHLFKQKLNITAMRTNVIDLDKKFNKVAILSGSGPSTLAYELCQNDTELIITSDIKWNEWILYQQHNIKILEISHLDEQVFAFDIVNQLQQNFANLNVYQYNFKELYQNL
ncbi:Nif3-like dinuclear metal center hexameric protein [Mycoplasmopsis phocirhinis]|uniref:GTP cyclohydrolase 1 type 2 homolog n=1 Tax=Mycoplasmopsis phocirhinis TaxID=142650 RepID=A0A4P6MN40_9BACT|nr:Nif3-like dinuclear metal center hexameric protein [Mycoplasmopsis phocirhinis]QBF34968.1 Nif3-like dinuclear metal center hexameric protein [Mycoplasmopsis phocirhinis]